MWQQHVIIPKLCERTWQAFVQAGKLSGELTEETGISWTAPRRELIDPVKETKGMSEMVRNGFMSYPEMVRSLGQDPDEVIEQIKACNEKLDQAGIVLVSDPRMDPARTKKETEEIDPADGEEAKGNPSKKEKGKKKEAGHLM